MMGTLAACGLPVLSCPVLPFAGMIGAKVLGTLALAISSHFPLRRGGSAGRWGRGKRGHVQKMKRERTGSCISTHLGAGTSPKRTELAAPNNMEQRGSSPLATKY